MKNLKELITKVYAPKAFLSILLGLVLTLIVFKKEMHSTNTLSKVHKLSDNNTEIFSRKPASFTKSSRQKFDSHIKASKVKARINALDKSKYISAVSDRQTDQSENYFNAGNSFETTRDNSNNPPSNNTVIDLDHVTDIFPTTEKSENIIPEDLLKIVKSDFTKKRDLNKAKVIKPDLENSESAGSSAGIPQTNICSSNIGSGTFGNPIGVVLACTNFSTIKYCLSKDVCCDPTTSGITYGTKVVIGPQNGSYCLSYYGDSVTDGTTAVFQQNFTINSAFPNLNVGQQKRYYQTTELDDSSQMTSLDFGKANMEVGQINLKSHNPGPSDLNYSCDDIVSNYSSLSSPVPIEVLPLLDVSSISASSQVEIPLRASDLEYGSNFITSYIRNNSYAASLYSCSTSEIVLEDFEYFQVDSSQSVAGNNTVREFEGEFSPYGFFEDDSVVFRGPAGVSSQEINGQNLKFGMMEIFY